MELSRTEHDILLKIYDECFLSLNDAIAVKLLYPIASKQYLWKSIKNLESKNIIISSKDGRKKYITLTSNGKRITKALVIIRNIK